jgi:hypothetical protein
MTEGKILVAKESFVIRWEGADVVFVAGETFVEEGHPILEGREKLFRPLAAHYRVEQATAWPGETRGAF